MKYWAAVVGLGVNGQEALGGVLNTVHVFMALNSDSQMLVDRSSRGVKNC